jgi:hypothetical protein
LQATGQLAAFNGCAMNHQDMRRCCARVSSKLVPCFKL